MQNMIAVAIGGALGSVFRWAVSLACVRWLAAPTVYATFAVNVVGCFLIGALATSPWGQRTLAHAAMSAGFLGGLTTFSTFGLETVRLIQNGSHLAAMLNVTASLALGLIAVVLGMQLGRSI
jgi:fluoride exporter